MLTNDLNVTVSQRKPACVLDPGLLLNHAIGPTLALRLARVFEVWLTRSFWQVIDSSDLWQRYADSQADQRRLLAARQVPDEYALNGWLLMRDSLNSASRGLFWLDDCPARSNAGDEVEADIIERYEWLAFNLSERVGQFDPNASATVPWCDGLDRVAAALDTLVLSVLLDSALVLCAVSADELPAPVLALQRAGLQADLLDPPAPAGLFAAERLWARNALAAAGLSALLEQLPGLVVVHALLPAPSLLGLLPTSEVDQLIQPDPWRNCRAWWYRV